MDSEEFRFGKKTEYELELARLLAEIGQRRRLKLRITKHEEKYEELVEEYVRFCGSEEGDGQE